MTQPLARRLGLLDVFCLGLNAIVGSGIFLFPGTLASLLGPASILAFPLCGLLLVPVALCYAELGAMFRENGGSALYAREAFGPAAGFGVGLIAWAAAALSWSAVAALLTSQLAHFHPALSSAAVAKTAAAACLLVFGAINYRGVKPGAWTVNALTAAKLLPLALLAAAGLAQADGANYRPLLGGEGRWGYALFLCLWTLQGFEVAPIPAGESSSPERDVPRATVGSLLFAALLYALIQAAALGVHPGLAASGTRPLTEAAQRALGSWGGSLLALGGTVSMLGFVAGTALGAPRYLTALDTPPSWGLSDAHRRFGTPHRAIVATTASAVALAVSLDFSRLIDLSNLAVVTQYFASCLALLRLRAARPELPRPFRVRRAAWVGVAGCAVSAWLAAQTSWKEAVAAGAVLLAGPLLHRACARGPREV